MSDRSEPYAPYGKFLWDLWLIKRGDTYHMFYLQADRSTNPELRDKLPTTIGHAISKDLTEWQELPTALRPSPVGTAWDDHALWSGSVVEKDGVYYLYYTGKNSLPSNAAAQKICLATSTDLLTWNKHPGNPIVEVDKRYYDESGLFFKNGVIGAWRDPFVFKDPHSEQHFMTISARDKSLTIQHDACVALAHSDDMVHWEVLPPIFSPGRYDKIDVTRVIFHNNYYYLFFTTYINSYEPTFSKKHGVYEGLHCYYSKDLRGGYQPVNGNGVVFDINRGVYDIRVLPHKGNEFIGIGWLNHDKEGRFIGKVAKPIKLKIEGDQIFVTR
jgi:beta-fructofuranosidase